MIKLLDVEKVRLLLRLDDEDINDKDLQKYIDHFTMTTLSRLGTQIQQNPSILDDPTFEEAVMAAIACRLSLTDLDVIHSPSGYRVGNTEEDYKNTSFGNYGQIPSWCDQYNDLLLTLSNQNAALNDVQVFRRKGMSVRRKYHRDLY